MAMYNKSKFRFSETFNNANGKTSGSGFVGVIMGLTTTIAFCVVLVGWWVGKPEVLEIFEKVIVDMDVEKIEELGQDIFDIAGNNQYIVKNQFQI